MSSGCNRDYWNTSLTQIIEAIMDDNWSLEQRPYTQVQPTVVIQLLIIGDNLLITFQRNN